jgi:hypothetical protein
MRANIIVNYIICGLSATAAALNTLPYGWSHVACIAISAGIGTATAASGTILSVRAVRSKSNG